LPDPIRCRLPHRPAAAQPNYGATGSPGEPYLYPERAVVLRPQPARWQILR